MLIGYRAESPVSSRVVRSRDGDTDLLGSISRHFLPSILAGVVIESGAEKLFSCSRQRRGDNISVGNIKEPAWEAFQAALRTLYTYSDRGKDKDVPKPRQLRGCSRSVVRQTSASPGQITTTIETISVPQKRINVKSINRGCYQYKMSKKWPPRKPRFRRYPSGHHFPHQLLGKSIWKVNLFVCVVEN